tara:strand:+ start:480 stop:629 length:150 start_codon:yes stop_codon:yes gene_type:complete
MLNNDEMIIICGIILISGIAIKYILNYHNLKEELVHDVVLAEDPLVIYN